MSGMPPDMATTSSDRRDYKLWERTVLLSSDLLIGNITRPQRERVSDLEALPSPFFSAHADFRRLPDPQSDKYCRLGRGKTLSSLHENLCNVVLQSKGETLHLIRVQGFLKSITHCMALDFPACIITVLESEPYPWQGSTPVAKWGPRADKNLIYDGEKKCS